jgi:prepilin-type N-terminal cleavage/methylation domain-containing protein
MSTSDLKNYGRKQALKLARGFTLVEILVAMSIGVALLGAVAVLFVTTARLIYKNQQIDAASTNTRLVQEHIYRELSSAISQKNPTPIGPTPIGTLSATNLYEGFTYRVPIGSYATVAANAQSTATSLTITCPADVIPKTGDFLLMDEPDLGRGIQITGAPGTSGLITVTLATSLNAASQGKFQTNNVGAVTGKLVRIQRERKYTTVDPATLGNASSPVTELQWYETTANTTPDLILSKNVDASARYLFYIDTAAAEPALSWQFNYRTADSNTGRLAGVSNADTYQINKAVGLIMPKSGDPLNSAGGGGGGGPGRIPRVPIPITTPTVRTTKVSPSGGDQTTTRTPKTTVNFDG